MRKLCSLFSAILVIVATKIQLISEITMLRTFFCIFTRLVIVFCLVSDGLFSIFGAKLDKQRYEEESDNVGTDVLNGCEWEGSDLWL